MNHKNNKNNTEKVEPRFVYLSILILLITFMIIPYSFSGSLGVGLTITSTTYTNDSVNTEANESIVIDAKSLTDTELTFVTNVNTTNQSVNITKQITNPTNETLLKTSLNKYITLNVSDALKNSLVYDLMKIFYTDTEIDTAMTDESTIIILYFNETSSVWHELTTDLDYVNSVGLNTTDQENYSGYAFANLSMFSIYALGGLLVDGAPCASASQCSGGYCCSNLCQSSACVTEEPPPGGGGGGSGVGGGVTRKGVYEITLFDESIKVGLRQGESEDFFLDILNSGTEKLELTLKIDGLEDMISIEGTRRKYEFEINAKETKTIKLTFFAGETLHPDVYVTRLSITGANIDEKLAIIAEVRTKDAALFDIDVEILEDYQRVKAGDKIITKIIVYNLGSKRRVDVKIDYSIKDLNGDIIISEHETLAVETVAEFTREIKLPSYLKEGIYAFGVTASYNGKIVTSGRTFEIVEEVTEVIEKPAPKEFISFNLVIYLAAALSALLIILTLLNIIGPIQYKRRVFAIAKKKKQMPKEEIPKEEMPKEEMPKEEMPKEEMPKREIPAKIKKHPEASPKHYFLLKDGRVLKNLKELKESYKDTDEETFRHHVNQDKNDFANWAKDVFKDTELAGKLKKAKTKEKCYKVLKKYFGK